MNNTFICSSNWLEVSNHEQTIEVLLGIALDHAAEAGPYSDELTEILVGRHWDRLIGFRIDYERGSWSHLYHARQALALFEKLECLPLGVDREAVAWLKFQEAEESCRQTNIRFRTARLDGFKTPSSVASVIYTAQRKISSVLGSVPSLQDLQLSYGPGANTTVKGTASSARWKLNTPPSCSFELASIASLVLRELPHYTYAFRVHDSDSLLGRLEDLCDNIAVPVECTNGRLQFVPKNAKTHRSIVVEPLLNSMLQKGIGKVISKRLRKIGIDIETQAERNKVFARVSSVDGQLATVDLSAASDTISREVVEELLPYDWVTLLRSARTGTVEYKGSTIALEKFSSMGNAYTFELETLIFWALASACCDVLSIDNSSVCSFGDDIIIPVDAYPLLTEVLSYCGFTINMEKTFVSGPFRESCGGDFLNGIDIRPFYFKKQVSGQTLFSLHNYYVRNLLPEYARKVLEMIHPSLRIFGPDGYGDGHLVGSWDGHTKSRHKKRGFEGVIFDTFTLRKRCNFKRLPVGDRLLPLYSIYSGLGDSAIDHYVVRGSAGYRRLSIYTLCTSVFSRM